MTATIATKELSIGIDSFAADVRLYLRKDQKELPSKYLYDELGSKLFEVICELPEYGLTRADERLLRAHAEEIAAQIPHTSLVAELGSGSGRKTRWILEALRRFNPVYYFPIEISSSALAVCERELSDIGSVTITGYEKDYLEGLLEVVTRRHPGEQLLVLFLGSTIGNFDPPNDMRFLSELRSILRRGDSLLLGTDLVKPVSRLIPAYDDPLGVTAAFNLNILTRLNRELNADFDFYQFRHSARFNEVTHSVEMHLVSKQDQLVSIRDAGIAVEFFEGETIWTETSHKYSLDEISHMASAVGFRLQEQWIDQEWPFAENLLIAE